MLLGFRIEDKGQFDGSKDFGFLVGGYVLSKLNITLGWAEFWLNDTGEDKGEAPEEPSLHIWLP